MILGKTYQGRIYESRLGVSTKSLLPLFDCMLQFLSSV
jgi:hypothetical protein